MKYDFLKTRKFWRIVWVTLLVVWIAFIFSNSLTSAENSKAQSDGIVKAIEETVQKVDPEFELSPKLVRKLAHFFEFFVLGILLSLSRLLFASSEDAFVFRTLFSGLLTAVFDETLQLVSPGRGSLVADVWIDFSAVVFALILFFVCTYIYRVNKKQKNL